MKSASCTSFPATKRKDLHPIFAARGLTPKRCDSASFFPVAPKDRERLLSQPAEDSRVCSKPPGTSEDFTDKTATSSKKARIECQRYAIRGTSNLPN